MRRKTWLSVILAALLGGTVPAYGQTGSASGTPLPPAAPPVVKPAEKPAPPPPPPAIIVPADTAASSCGPDACGDDGPKYGPTPPEEVKILMDTALGQRLDEWGVRAYGWLEMGYTYSSTGSGILTVEPRENRFGNEFLVNEITLVIEKPLKTDELSMGYYVRYYGGADAALLQPKGGIDDPINDPRFSHDFRDLYLTVHLPVLSEGGVDLKLGRQTTPIGYSGAMGPFHTFYSNDYQWFYSQDGAWTGALANWHVSKQLDVLNGFTLGANTFFTKRSNNSICYIGQINYWLQEDKRTQLTASAHIGENAIFAAPGLAGDFVTMFEGRVQHKWGPRFEQILQTNFGWDQDIPGIGTGFWWGVYTIGIFHLSPTLDLLTRGEWFWDNDGTRTGFDTHYAAATLGFDYHPVKALSLRPEIRGDFADTRVFRDGRDHSQLTLAIDALLKF